MPDERDLDRRLTQMEGWKAYVDEWRHGFDEWRHNMEYNGQGYHMVRGTIPMWLVFLAAALAAFIIVIGLLLLARGGILP